VVVLVQPASGDDVQMLKAGILEIGDVFVVNKADMDGTARTVAELEEMIHLRSDSPKPLDTGHHGPETTHTDADAGTDHSGNGDGGIAPDDETADGGDDEPEWTPEVVETVATSGDGIDDLVAQLDAHHDFLARSGRLRERARTRYAEKIRTLIQSDVSDLVAHELDARGGVDALAEAVLDRETDPYTVADEVVSPIQDCVDAADD
jgi:LAO/AO transport system kinase